MYVNNARIYGKSGWGAHPDFPWDTIITDPSESKTIIEECKKDADNYMDSCCETIAKKIEKEYENRFSIMYGKLT